MACSYVCRYEVHIWFAVMCVDMKSIYGLQLCDCVDMKSIFGLQLCMQV